MTTQIKDHLSKTYGLKFKAADRAGFLYEEGRTMKKDYFSITIIKSHPSINNKHYDSTTYWWSPVGSISINYYTKSLLDNDFNYGNDIKQKSFIFGDKTYEQIVKEVEDYCLLNGPLWLRRDININKIIF